MNTTACGVAKPRLLVKLDHPMRNSLLELLRCTLRWRLRVGLKKMLREKV